MTTTLFIEVSYSLSKLIDDIERGEIGLPDIQRPFVWKNAKVRDLFDSIYRGYPIGYFLFWENKVGQKTKRIGQNGSLAVREMSGIHSSMNISRIVNSTTASTVSRY